jgi:FtsZ-binding cell division protein ZapB
MTTDTTDLVESQIKAVKESLDLAQTLEYLSAYSSSELKKKKYNTKQAGQDAERYIKIFQAENARFKKESDNLKQYLDSLQEIYESNGVSQRKQNVSKGKKKARKK